MRFILGHSILRPLLASVATLNFFNFVFAALFILYATRELHVRSGTLGIVLGAGAIGGLLGAAVAGRLTRRFGIGPIFVFGMVLFPAPLLLVPLAGGPKTAVLAMLFAAEFLSGLGVMILDISAGAIITALTPHRLRSRSTGALRFVNFGVRPLGALAGGALGSAFGLRPTLWFAAAAGVLGVAVARPVAGSEAPGTSGGGSGVSVVRSPAELEPTERAVAIGTFDGVHRGHRAAIEAAKAAGLRSTVVTFDPHPRLVLGYDVQLLTTLRRRIELIEEAGPDDILLIEFTEALSRLEPEEFVARILEPIGTKAVVAAETFRFGRGRKGDVGLLRRLGLEVIDVPLVEGVSSSRIRELLAEGEMREAAAPPRQAARARRHGCLGRPARRHARVPDRQPRSRAASPRARIRDLRGRGSWRARSDLDRGQPALRRE